MIRLGLCCKFKEEPIRFKIATARYLSRMTSRERKVKLSSLVLHNAGALLQAIEYCASNDIGCFRVNSRILPLKTHPDLGYSVGSLTDRKEIISTFSICKNRALKLNVRLTFHPDQFIVLSSPDKGVIKRSVDELDYQAEVSEWIGADVINIHGGGAYGDKCSALERVSAVLDKLAPSVRKRLTFENDERVYSPSDLLPFCKTHGIPFVYDIHHHRCLPDGLSVEMVTRRAIKTWGREPLFHVSSSRDGWNSRTPGPHHDYIDIKDFPECWRGLDITVEVEAKAKELAVKRLRDSLG